MIYPSRRQVLAGSAALFLARRLGAIPLTDIKLGILTDEIDDDVQVAADFLSAHDLKWTEIRNIWGKYNTEQPVEKVKEAARILQQAKIEVSIEATGVFKIPLPPDTPQGHEKLDGQWALLERSMQRATLFGTRKLRIFSFTLGQGEKPSASGYARIDELLSEAAHRASAGGFQLAVENIGGGHVATGEQAGALMKRHKENNLGITWDPNNAGESGEKPYPDGYRHLDPARIFHVHLRDYVHLPGGKVDWAPVGAGELDNLGQVRALRKDGYRGTYTLETHWRDPQYKGDPKQPMRSTETSLKGLMQVIAKV